MTDKKKTTTEISVSPIRTFLKKGKIGIIRSAKDKKAPSRRIPLSMADNLSENFSRKVSRNKYLEIRKLRVAPIVLMKETIIVPVTTPNKAPPANVRIAAPGSATATETI